MWSLSWVRIERPAGHVAELFCQNVAGKEAGLYRRFHLATSQTALPVSAKSAHPGLGHLPLEDRLAGSVILRSSRQAGELTMSKASKILPRSKKGEHDGNESEYRNDYK